MVQKELGWANTKGGIECKELSCTGHCFDQSNAAQTGIFFVIDVSSVAYQRDLVTLTVNAIKDGLHELRESYSNGYEQKESEQCMLGYPCTFYRNL